MEETHLDKVVMESPTLTQVLETLEVAGHVTTYENSKTSFYGANWILRKLKAGHRASLLCKT